MQPVPLTAAQSAFISDAVESLLSDPPPTMRWQLDQVRRHHALPLVFSWTATIGIRADGTLVRWETESLDLDVNELEDGTWTRTLALAEASRTYPELAGLRPPRPPDATTCDPCKGAGWIQLQFESGKGEVYCKCAGLGWRGEGGVRLDEPDRHEASPKASGG
jgi:hypothetical protein